MNQSDQVAWLAVDSLEANWTFAESRYFVIIIEESPFSYQHYYFVLLLIVSVF